MWRTNREADIACHVQEWSQVEEASCGPWSFQRRRTQLLVNYSPPFAPYFIRTSAVLKDLVFTGMTSSQSSIYTHTLHTYHSIPESVEHRLLRSRKANPVSLTEVKTEPGTPLSPTKPSTWSPLGSPSKVVDVLFIKL